jgi:hypothetical protein
MMDFLQHADVSFVSDENVGQLCEELSNIYGGSIWYDTFKFQNTKCLWFVNDVVATMKSNKVPSGSFGLYPSFVAGILNLLKEMNFCYLQ